MKANDLEKEFSRMNDLFEYLKLSAEERTARTVYSKGPYFDFPVFSYQRKRMQKGRLINNIRRIRNYDDVRFYMFDSSGNMIREGWDGPPEGSSYNTFYEYHKNGLLYLSYTYGDMNNQPANVTTYEFSSGKLLLLMLHGLYGVLKEQYFYEDDSLKKIDVLMRGHGSEKIEKVSEHFNYDNSRRLRSIEIEYKTGDSEIIYEDLESR